MGEIDDVEDAVDQREAERDQRVDGAGQQAVEDRGNEDGGREHGGLRVRRRATPAGGAIDGAAGQIARDQAGGIGNTGFAEAKAAGKITWMSLSSTCVLTGAAPWFWPLTNLVGP